MGLFTNKKEPKKKQSTDDTDAASVTDEVFDEAYREELRQLGRDYFEHALDESTVDLKHDIDAMMHQLALDMREYMTKQLDLTIGNINTEITNQMNERIGEFNRVTGEAQDAATQSLSRTTQLLYEKYQQLSVNLQQAISNQEVQMIAVFQENKAQVSSSQDEQRRALQSLHEAVASSQENINQLNQRLHEAIDEQSSRLGEVYEENMQRVEATKEAQAHTLDELSTSAKALSEKHQQLSELLDSSVEKQKAMVAETINDNMSRIIEHYLIGALGEQSDVKTQLPSILEQMEEHKQAMMDDMKL